MNLTKSKTAKIAAGVVGFAMVVTAFMPVLASADTASDLQAQINSLLATIQSLQAQLAATTGGSSSVGSFSFSTNLTVGSKGTDVMNLQKVLNMSADTQVAASGPGSKGMETSTFGPLTKAAVIKFQIKFGISPAAGYVGPKTRAKLSTMGGVSSTPTPVTPGTPTGGALSVSSAVQPSNSLAPKNASRVPFTRFTLTAGASDVTVNSVTVQRSGFANDAVFSGIVLLDQNGMQVGISKTLNSNHQANLGDNFIVRAGTSQTYTVAGNMASDESSYVGQIASLDVVAVNSSATVSGALPITGAQQTVNNSLTVGTVTIGTSSFDPNNGASNSVGTTGLRFTGFRITAGSAEDLTLKSIRWNQSGSAGSNDLGNIMTVVNGVSYPTTVSADGKYYSTVFPSGIVIAKGNSVDVYVQGDLVGSGAAGRTVEFDVYKNTDLYLSGNTYGYGITAATGSGVVLTTANHATVLNTSSNPWLEGSQMSVTAGQVTLIGKASEIAAQNIATNVPNQPLGGFATNFTGEPVSVQGLWLVLSTTTTAGPTANSPFSAITNITLVDQNGAVVAGPVDATVGDGTSSHGGITPNTSGYAVVHFTDTVTFPVGRRVYTVKGKIPSAWANGATVTLYTKPSTDFTTPTGQTTGNSVDLSSQATAFTMNQMTVKGAALQVNIAAQPASQNVVGGVQGFVLANYQFDATQSGEDVRLSSMPVVITAGGAATASQLTGCQLWNGTTPLNTGSGVVNTFSSGTAKTYSFDNALIIPKGTAVTLSLACNVSSAVTSGTFQVSADSTTSDWSVTGLTSGNTVTPTFGTGSGGTMTVGTGSFAVTVDSSSPATTTVAGGASGITLGVFKFRASNEDINLTKVAIQLATGTSANIGTMYVYQGSTLLGTAIFPQGNLAIATSTLNTPFKLTRDTDVLITVKADMAAIGTGQSGVEGQPVIANVSVAEGSGLSSGLTLDVVGISTGAAGVRTFKSFPTVAADTLPGTGVADGKLMRFKITADSHGQVGIYQLSFKVATSSFATGGGVSNVKVMVYSDAAYSQPVSGTYGAATGQFGATASVFSTNTTFNVTATTNPLEIPAGTTYYVQLESTVQSTQTGTSVTTTLNGDAAYISAAHLGASFVSTTTGAVADTNNNFIWSGNATSTAVFNSNDWANGFSILGLPSGGLSQTRSN